MSIKLDFSRFKHVKSDGNSTTLQHKKDGHTITLMHKALSPQNQEHLAALSGIAKADENTDDQLDMQKQKFAEGGEAYLPCLNPNCKSHGRPHPNCTCYGPGGNKMARGGPVVQYCAHGKPHKPDCMYYKGGKVAKYADGTPDVAADDAQMPTPYPSPQDEPTPSKEDNKDDYKGHDADNSVPDSAQAPMDSVGIPLTTSQDNSPPPGAGTAQPLDPNSPAPEPSGAPAAASSSPPAQPAPNYRADNSESEAPPPISKGQDIYNDLVDQDRKIAADFANGHITPKNYHDLFEGATIGGNHTLGKIGTLFGMLLSGAGSGLAHQPNMVLSMMDNEIQRNLEAQKAQKTGQTNYLQMSMNNALEKARIDQQAPLTKAQTYEIQQRSLAEHNILLNRAAFQKMTDLFNAMPPGLPGSPEAAKKEAMSKQLAIMSDGVQNENYSIAARAAAAGEKGHLLYDTPQDAALDKEASFRKRVQGMQMSGPDGKAQAQFLIDRHVPGYDNVAEAGPINDGVKNELTAYKNTNDLINEASNIAKMGSLDKLSPKLQARVPTLMNELGSTIRIAEDQGVFKKSEADNMRETLGHSPAGFLSKWNSLPKLQELQKIKSNQYNALAAEHGLRPQAPLAMSSEQPQGGQSSVQEGALGSFKDPKTGKETPVVRRNNRWVPR